MKVFYFNANEVSDNEIEKILSHSEKHRAARYKKAVSVISGRETLCAGFLLRYAVSQYANIPFEDVKSAYDPSGRPILASPENITPLYVSLTHTQGHIFCAVSSAPVGIDAEVLRTFDTALAKRFFNDKEQAYIAAAKDDDEARTRFFEIWTLKEACFKQGTVDIKSFLEADFMAVRDKSSRIYGDMLLSVVGDSDLSEIENVTEKALKFFL